MPLQTETIDIDEEIERLGEEMDDVADEQAEWLDGGHGWEHSRVQQLFERGGQLDQHRSGLRWLREERDAETVTLSGLTAGETHLVQDLADEGVMLEAAYISVGTTEAPWLAHDPDKSLDANREDVKDTARNVVDLPNPLVKWAEERIHDLTSPGDDEGNGFMGLLQEKMSEQAPPDESG